jgi:hypothetical protein
MNAQEAQTLQLHEMVVWTPDGMKGEVIVKDGSNSAFAFSMPGLPGHFVD